MGVPERFGGAKLAAAVLVASQVLAAGGAVAVNLLAAFVLSPSGRGDLAFALQLAYFLSVFAIMGLERPFIAARSGGFGTEYRVFARMVTPGTLCTLPVVILAVVLSPFSTDWVWMGLIAIAGYVALNSLVRALRVAYVCSREWKWFTANAVATQVIIVIGATLLVLLDVDDPVLWMWTYTASALPAVALLFLAPKTWKSSVPTRDESRGLRRRGLVLLASDFSNTAMLRSDRLLLPMLSSSAALGLYVTVATVLEMATWPVQQWVDASLRSWSTAFSSRPLPVVRLVGGSLLLLAVFAGLLGSAAWAMITFVLPESYLPATAVIIPLAISAIVFGLTRVQQGLLIAADAPGTVSIVEIIGTVASMLAYLTLIPSFGMLGAAYGSIIGYSVCAAAGAIALTRVMRGRTAEPNRRRPLERAQIGAIREPVKPALMAVADEPASDTGGRTPDETRK
ncbi:polysaccharide biosynthesis C-terminal domain-containing protein [Brevibacterium sp. K11IcPPYGO002]|uniref:lipopolysaccharide biosynthesis protein n=1 Tax=Brevibacterium sp. K11IcPPYGO002 TaxID=3058837 RepID=UPI003D817363